MNVKSTIKKNTLIMSVYKDLRYFYYKNFISNEEFNRRKFKKRLGREMDIDNPVYFNDKLQWLKLRWYDPLAAKCADKYRVRDFVKNSIGEKYLNEIYGVYDSVNEIDPENLPNSFVLKGTHGSGFNIICRDKNKLNWNMAYKAMRKWLKKNYYWTTREWVYKDIKPRIICEKYLCNKAGEPPRDYKIFCFNGEPKLIQVDLNRFNGHKQNFYDVDWTLQRIESKIPSDINANIEKPESLDEMLVLSKALSHKFPFVRVDLYNLDGHIIFGELTFFPHSGAGKFLPLEFEKKLGSYLRLSRLE